ncbi:MAG: hypothetical protein JO354_13980 [Verrucomicrobia bacterium]|nr:hypothetical protein [Verrucomicrobiota bacterium]
MIADVRERLDKIPFEAFVIRQSDGRQYPVPTRDHAHISPRGNRIVVFLDDGPAITLGPLHVNSIVDLRSTAG